MIDDLILKVSIAAVCIAFGFGFGHAWREDTFRVDMIQRGYAEYVMDPKTGVSTWRMKDDSTLKQQTTQQP